MVPVPTVQDPGQRGSLPASSWQVLLQDEHQDQVALGGEVRDIRSDDSPAFGPPGVDLPEDADPLAAWDGFLARVGVPEEQRNTRSAIEDPAGTARGCSSSACPEG